MSTKLEPLFEIGDRVRVVTCDTEFFGWAGAVTDVEVGTFMPEVIHYFVAMDGLSVSISPPLLFREIQLAHSE